MTTKILPKILSFLPPQASTSIIHGRLHQDSQRVAMRIDRSSVPTFFPSVYAINCKSVSTVAPENVVPFPTFRRNISSWALRSNPSCDNIQQPITSRMCFYTRVLGETSPMKKLPCGIQNIRELLTKNYVYSDKTSHAERLIDGGKHYFLSRPRRFGKSLFLDTLKEILEGNRDLFKGCHIYDGDYSWEKHPVVYLDFSQISNRTPESFESSIKEALEEVAKSHEVSIRGSSPQSLLRSLVRELSKHNRVAVLVDEYDKPIIDRLGDLNVARENRDILGGFFGTLKSLDAQLKFSFITGVSKFSHVSIFSGANNLTDLTMKPEYADMIGFTEEELSQHFLQHMQSIAKKRSQTGESVTGKEILDEMRTWYNGYRFSNKETYVYNPFSTLNFLNNGVSKAYWYASGTPSFLIDQVKKHPESMVSLEGTTAKEEDLMDLSGFDNIDLSALMYQTGYFTIKDYNPISKRYSLGFPNEEVRSAFINSLVKNFAPITKLRSSEEFVTALEEHQPDFLFKHIETGFASFAYQVFVDAKERTYQGMLLSILYGMGFDPLSERSTNTGRIDVVLEVPNTTYIMELKLDGSSSDALKQIHDKAYFKPYTQKGKKIAIIGANFSSKNRNVSDWKAELLSEKGELIKEILPHKGE